MQVHYIHESVVGTEKLIVCVHSLRRCWRNKVTVPPVLLLLAERALFDLEKRVRDWKEFSIWRGERDRPIIRRVCSHSLTYKLFTM